MEDCGEKVGVDSKRPRVSCLFWIFISGPTLCVRRLVLRLRRRCGFGAGAPFEVLAEATNTTYFHLFH